VGTHVDARAPLLQGVRLRRPTIVDQRGQQRVHADQTLRSLIEDGRRSRQGADQAKVDRESIGPAHTKQVRPVGGNVEGDDGTFEKYSGIVSEEDAASGIAAAIERDRAILDGPRTKNANGYAAAVVSRGCVAGDGTVLDDHRLGVHAEEAASA